MALDTQNSKSILWVIAPQYVASPRVDDLIALMEFSVSLCFGEKRAYAIALRVAHTLAMQEANGGGNSSSGSGMSAPVSALKEGDISVSYSSKSSTAGATWGDLPNTTYGTEYIALAKALHRSPINRFSGGC